MAWFKCTKCGKKYFEGNPPKICPDCNAGAEYFEKLREKIVFEQGNIEDKIDEIKPGNSLVMCRNFWPYLDEKRAKEILRKLCSKLDESSLIVVGNYDRYISHMVLNQEGFKEIYPNIFKKEKPRCDFWIY